MTVLLVDDEALVRSYIRLLLEQQSEPAMTCVEAVSAAEALRRLEEEDIDIALIDVRMPGMNGVELVRQVTSRWPQVACVMLSGHDDFAYVRDSMTYGAIDYLLKHRVTGERLAVVMRQAAQWRSEKLRAEAQVAQAARTAREALPLLRERMLRAAMAGEAPAEDAAALWSEIVTLHEGTVRLAVFALNRTDLYAQRPERAVNLRQLTQSVLQEALGEKCPVLSMADQHLVALVGTERTTRPGDLTKGGNALRLFLNLTTQVVVSAPFNELTQCEERYRQALLQLDAQRPVTRLTTEQTERLLRALNSGSEIFLRTESARLFGALTGLSGEAQAAVVEDVLAVLWLFAGQRGLNADALLQEPLRTLRAAAENAPRALLDMAQRLLRASGGKTEGAGHSVHIEQAMTYIQGHYAEQLTLDGVAAQVNVSPAYLSRLFREECDCTFTEYINNLRVDLAGRHLRSGLSAKETSQLVGFANLSYFFRVFKTVTGHTPAEFSKEYKIVHDSDKPVD